MLLLVLAFTGIIGTQGAPSTQNVAQFGSMISCATGKGYLEATLAYNGYGCYCGLGGEGTPLDDTDQCCFYHDNCYTVLQSESNSKCPNSFNVYVTMYHYQTSSCGNEQASIVCTPSEDYPLGFTEPECAEAICKCDRAAAMCFAATMGSYDNSYRNWPRSNCV
ncbi:basic phospholipase A2 caudoxin-like [Ptychodera flava]|uniref:basic phospholipase A2 caudoxin-like n=1 Tax=Ptychodera flava TaxID=63121 RepID=UPI00396A7BDE